MMIKNIIFDLGGVLIDLDKMACVDGLVKLGFTDVDKYLGNFVQSGFFLDFEMGLISVNEFIASIRANLTHEASDEDIKSVWKSFLLGIDNYKLEKLTQLKSQYNLYLLSNTNAIHFPMINAKYKLDTYFDKFYLSYEMHLAKPDKAIFNCILNDQNIKADETLFVDDGPDNIRVASELGFKTHLATKELFFPASF